MLRAPRFVGLLGWPLETTLSPALHNAAFKALRMDWVYLVWPTPPDSLRAAVEGLRALGAEGANVTMPHKQAVVELLDEVTPEARRVGAVNTIGRAGGSLVGHNTDLDGFRDFLVEDAGAEVRTKRALVLGSGGAARAVVCALDDLGAASVTVASRDPGRGAQVAALAAAGTVVPFDRAPEIAGLSDVVVNATPLGAEGEDALGQLEWRPGQMVCDLVYAPPITPLVAGARARAADAWGGLGMLIHQAAASFRVWTGREAPVETMSAAAVRALGVP